jgi:hypothetical protein
MLQGDQLILNDTPDDIGGANKRAKTPKNRDHQKLTPSASSCALPGQTSRANSQV